MFNKTIGLFLLVVLNADKSGFMQGPVQTHDEMRGAAIRFERFGGFAGISTHYWVFADGRILDEEGKESRIAPKKVESLVSRIRTLALPANRNPSMCMDCFRYRVSILYGSGTRSFVVDEDVLQRPDPDARIVNELLALLPNRKHSS